MKASRRDIIKGAIKAGVYVAPMVTLVAKPILAAAQVVTGPMGIRFAVIPIIGPRNQLFSFAASGLTPNARYNIVRISGPGGLGLSIRGTVTATAGGAVGFSVYAGTFDPAGTYAVGITLAGTTNIVVQFTTTVTATGNPPSVPGILVNPTSGPSGTAFAFVAVGLIGSTRYDALLLSSPSGATARIVTETTIGSGQFDFFFDSTASPAGTYRFGAARSGTNVVAAQTSIILTTSASINPASSTLIERESGARFPLGD